VRSSARRLAVAGDQVVEDLAEAGRDRARARALDAGGSSTVQALGDHLPREVDVGAVLEDDVTCDRPNARSSAPRPGRQARERLLDAGGDLALDLERRQRRRHGVDLHLDRRGVGERVDGQALERQHAGDRDAEPAADHREPVLQRPGDDAFSISRYRSSRRRCCPSASRS
jgi:hypothetical protein